MKKRTRTMLLSILMIITLLATDFFILGSGIITYASDFNSQTANSNIEFLAYFKKDNQKVDSIEKNIKDGDVRLYAQIKVKNDGYLKEGTVIEIANSNFNLKNEILPSNSRINSIEGNKVNLKQINNGETIEVELGIEPIIAEKISSDFLSKVSTVKMISTYVYSKAEDGESVVSEKEVCVSYKPDDTLAAELETNIITNNELKINGTDQKVVQLLIKSRLNNNEYPAKETILKVGIPTINENIPEVSAIAVNDKTQISKFTSANGIAEIRLNYQDENSQVNWNKNVYDEIVVTYIYPKDVDTSNVEIKTDSEIQVYNSSKTYTAQYTKGIGTQELSSVIMGKTEITTKEINKGQLYANLETEYNTKTSIAITNADAIDEIVVNEGPDAFGTAESELQANTIYKTTEINLQKMLDMLGQDGKITIKNGDEDPLIINNESQVDENGNVIIEHKNSTAELQIITSKPTNTGILEIKHTKVITGNNYKRTDLQQIKTLKAKNTTSAKLEGTDIVKNITEIATLELEETVSKAELTLDRTTLSTTQSNEVILGITLVTNEIEYDLYKNPKISVKFPSAVKNVELTSKASIQNADEFTVNVGEFDTTKKTMLIDLQGEQTTYAKTELTQPHIQLNLNVTLEPLALAQTDKIMIAYTNENAIQYEGGRTEAGVIEKEIDISAPSQLIKSFNLSSNENTSYTETILEHVKQNEAGKTLDFEISLRNNKDSALSDLKILGKLPTTQNTIAGQEENTLETLLRSITAENATIYYTENSSATADVNNAENGWTQDLSSLMSAKLYLIKVDSLERGAKFEAKVTVQLPLTRSVTESGISYTQYGVIYDTATESEVKESSRKIGLATSAVANIKTEITAKVGQDTLNNGDTVKEGEVIRYTVTVKNQGTSTLENVQLKLDVPEGTLYVRPVPKITNENGVVTQPGYVYIDGYYEEITDNEQLAKLTNITIPQLSTTEAYSIEYEVRVNKGAVGTDISNKPTVIYSEIEVGSAEFNNIINESNIRVTIKKASDETMQMYAGGKAYYKAYIENLSSEKINNLEMQILSSQFNITKVDKDNKALHEGDVPEKLSVSELEANSKTDFYIIGLIENDVTEINISAIVRDQQGNTYKSNALKEDLPNVEATVNIESKQDGKYIKQGDIVEYNITLKNTGDIKANIGIIDNIPSILQVQAIYINGQIQEQSINAEETATYNSTISNDISEIIILNAKETAECKITAKVGYIPDTEHGKVITNSAQVRAFNILEGSSEIITHTLISSENPEKDVENIISGFAWYDSNKNGRKESDEEALSGVTVKLYDISAKSYLKDENEEDIKIETDENGQYIFLNIKDGSYLIVFEYDTEKYVLTTANAENVDSSINSKTIIESITDDKYITRIAAIKINQLTENIFGMNLGLIENTGDTPSEEQPGVEEIPDTPTIPDNPTTPGAPTNPDTPTTPENPTNPDNPTTPGDPTNPDNPTTPGDPTTPEEPIIPDNPTNPDDSTDTQEPTNPDNPGNIEKPEEPVDTKTLSGLVWLDSNINGKKDKDDTNLSQIIVRLYDVTAKDFLTDENGKIVELTTDDNGRYEFSNIEKGTYIVIFEFNAEKYKLAIQNSNVALKKLEINGTEKIVAVTDVIEVQNNVSNINIGFKENLIFDLELNKYISKIVVQTNKETKTYDYNEKMLGKIEIHKKQIQGALVVLEYNIEIKNTGEIAGYVKNIVDYLPSGLSFSSELNTDWYISGNNLYTKSLENIELKPGEEKELKLVLTKTMTSENVGLINNRAEIYDDYNQYGESDIDSTPNNQNQNEDDFGTTDVIIQVATGGSIVTYIMLAVINIGLIYVAIKIMIKNEIIQIKTKEERG